MVKVIANARAAGAKVAIGGERVGSSGNFFAPTVLTEPVWHARAAAHEARVRVWTDPHVARAGRGEKHPVYDFLFNYYAFRSAWLRRWHPGPDLALAGESARAYLRWSEYRELSPCSESGTGVPPVISASRPPSSAAPAVTLAPLPPARRAFVTWLRDLLTATGSTLEHGGVNFFVLNDEPTKCAETVSIAFLGTSIGCAKCHNHPM